jgi:hypothetical protein
MSAFSKPEEIVWAFDFGKGFIGDSRRRRDNAPSAVREEARFLQKALLLIPAEFTEIKMGLRLAPAPVQELRLMSGLSCDLRSLADRFLRTADPQVLIS